MVLTQNGRAGPMERAGGEAARRPQIADHVMSRRAVIGGGLAGLGGLLLFPGLSLAGAAVPSDPLVVVLRGLYQPVVHGPDLGLPTVDLNDGSYITDPIYPVSGIPGNRDAQSAIGRFWVQPNGDLCAYHIPGGSLAMRFIGSDVNIVPDGAGGNWLTGTWELTILEATGIYRPFVGGHTQMVDTLHLLASGGADEVSCFCHIGRPQTCEAPEHEKRRATAEAVARLSAGLEAGERQPDRTANQQQRPSRVPTAAEVRAYLESPPDLWAKTSDAGGHAIAEAVFERMDVLGRTNSRSH